jgi:hypothetical protein
MPAGPAHRLVSASDLKRQRGWTETLVVALLGAPDALCPNPHGYRPPMRWYRVDRVLAAEREELFRRRAGQLSEQAAWRRTQPTRTYASEELEHLEWLEDPWRIALFHAPRRPRPRRRRPPAGPPEAPVAVAAPVRQPPLRFEVLRLFDPGPPVAVARVGRRVRT